MNGVANGVYGGDLPNVINTPWIDFSQQSTIVGWSSTTTRRVFYKVFGKTVTVFFTITGTSNSAITTIQLPIRASSVMPLYLNSCYITFNATLGENGACAINTSSDATIISIFRNYGGTALSNTGNKEVIGSITYIID
jgi:hypothetical protein